MAGNDHGQKIMTKVGPHSFLKNWKAELDSHEIYLVLAQLEKGNKKGALFFSLAEESLKQAQIWKSKGAETNGWIYRKDLKIQFLIYLLNKWGPLYFLQLLSSMKIRGISLYRLGETHLEENSLEKEKIHSGISSGTNLRAAIFGINDGLVSNASLVFAMVGANSENQTIILTGIAGLLAGGFSMASGEYVSVKSQTELYENQIALERDELQEFPVEEAKELALIYQAKGLNETLANEMASSLVQNKEMALDTLAREELGLNPNELGSPIQAALSSFVCFSFGAAIPLLPFLFMDKVGASSISLVTSLLLLFAIGVLISFFTGKSPLKNGLRMCLLGLMAGGSTFFIGKLIGVSVN